MSMVDILRQLRCLLHVTSCNPKNPQRIHNEQTFISHYKKKSFFCWYVCHLNLIFRKENDINNQPFRGSTTLMWLKSPKHFGEIGRWVCLQRPTHKSFTVIIDQIIIPTWVHIFVYLLQAPSSSTYITLFVLFLHQIFGCPHVVLLHAVLPKVESCRNCWLQR